MKRETTIIYANWYETIEEMCQTDKEKVAAYNNIFQYAFYGIEPKNNDYAAKLIFKMAKFSIDKNNENYINGHKGGRPKKVEVEAEVEKNEVEKKPVVKPVVKPVDKPAGKTLPLTLTLTNSLNKEYNNTSLKEKEEEEKEEEEKEKNNQIDNQIENQIEKDKNKKAFEVALKNAVGSLTAQDVVVSIDTVEFKNPKLQIFVSERFDTSIQNKWADWIIDHKEAGTKLSTEWVLKLLTKFQMDLEPEIKFENIKTEWANFFDNFDYWAKKHNYLDK